MVRAVRKHVTVGPGGHIEMQDAGLPEGTLAEVIVLVDQAEPDGSLPPLSSLVGAGQGLYSTPEEADAYLHRLRSEWD